VLAGLVGKMESAITVRNQPSEERRRSARVVEVIDPEDVERYKRDQRGRLNQMLQQRLTDRSKGIECSEVDTTDDTTFVVFSIEHPELGKHKVEVSIAQVSPVCECGAMRRHKYESTFALIPGDESPMLSMDVFGMWFANQSSANLRYIRHISSIVFGKWIPSINSCVDLMLELRDNIL